MNTITISTCGQFVELWHNGSKIRWHAVRDDNLRTAVDECREYIRKWTGDTSPAISRALLTRLEQLPVDSAPPADA